MLQNRFRVKSHALKYMFFRHGKYFGAMIPTRLVVLAALVLCLGASLVSADQSSNPTNSPSTSSASRQILVGAAHPVFVDPSTGATLWTANVERSEASTGENGSIIGQMDGVDGILYEGGKPADKFLAAKVIYDNARKIVVARGGVKITSLTQSSTTLTCDKVVWYMGKNKLVGSGHVVFRAQGFTQTGPSFQADTKIKDVVMQSTQRQRIHMTFMP
jgi:hypothetical protein